MDLKFVESILETYCPLMEGRKIRLEALSAQPVVKFYTDGGSMKQILFRLILEPLQGWDEQCGQPNSFFDLFSEWAASAKLPAHSQACKPVRLEILQDGAVWVNDSKETHYYIQCRLLYRCAAQPIMEGPLVAKNEKVAFYQVRPDAVYRRMEEFTQLSADKNASIKQCGETFWIHYRPVLQYCFDRFRDNLVHNDLAAVHADEKAGTAEFRKVLVADFTRPVRQDTYIATMHTFAVVPGTEGDALRTCRYSGKLYALDVAANGYVSSDDGWQSCSFVPDAHL